MAFGAFLFIIRTHLSIRLPKLARNSKFGVFQVHPEFYGPFYYLSHPRHGPLPCQFAGRIGNG